MEKKQSSIDSFVQQLKRKGLLLTEDSEYIVAYLKAKAMHKEEMINFSYKVLNESNDSFNGYVDEEKIYNETFGDNNE